MDTFNERQAVYAATDSCAAGCPEALAQNLPSVVVERRVEWPDTDAAGHYHHSTVVRWVEAAEAVLLRRLGLAHLFGSTPRVHFEADYRARLWFGEAVRTELKVVKVGTSSLHYAFTVHGEGRSRPRAGAWSSPTRLRAPPDPRPGPMTYARSSPRPVRSPPSSSRDPTHRTTQDVLHS
ncbi:acyl-CoA thioesterase [Streptomyces sp. NBC_00162]|uniref:acyl-CoA thioesterase n=1 Tax=Streptomyces sp. NBC_00162 TaxID=2903629 RepID=UPI00214B044C|nr:acyl-CoA thioesterase [Streptomyces sp. NBC_00162]UUU38851.1 acyl-CoA thioesterase [Streptomyces sp. NBC_00162]